jgi:NodT family efflux transporter outer membrane factor (OMF) lipoprotein
MGSTVVSGKAGGRRRRGLALLAAGCSLLPAAGCAWIRNGFKVGPNYTTPAAPVASGWIDYEDPRLGGEEQQLGEWWRVFNDPMLDSLIENVYAQNLTLRVAGARILAARARRGFAIGELFPQLQDATGSFTANKLSENTAAGPPPEIWFQSSAASFNMSWELDIWGRFRRGIESADAALDASIDNYDDFLVILFADVAASYIQFRTFQERLVYARQNVYIQERSYQLARDRFEAGAVTERDVHQARQALEQTRALIPLLETGLRITNNAMCALQGMTPADLAEHLGEGIAIPGAPRNVTVGVPADLLRRRPDVRRTERLAAAQSAQIGIAESDLYPRFFLAGSIGVSAEQAGDLFDGSRSLSAFGGPAFQWNILNYGRIGSNIDEQKARFLELVYAYQEQVLQAGREAEDAMVAFLNSHERSERLAESVSAARRSVEITFDQYREGLVDFTAVFLFEQTLAEQEDQFAQARGDIALNLVDLYRSLGGGWEFRLSREDPGAHPDDPAPPADDGAAG